MSYKTDIEIAQEAEMKPISQIADSLGITREDYDLYGDYKAKIDPYRFKDDDHKAKLILVTAITPTPAGEGKTTTAIGLADGLNKIGKKAILALREPSLGPVFGIKGGAAGGGYAQVIPMEDINLHFTGDLHALGVANNLLAALLDNHIQQGNELGIDVRRITWKRAVDMNDRQLRNIVNGLGKRTDGTPREDGFDIVVASEVMAILCLATDVNDLKDRLSRIVVAYNFDNEPIYAKDLKAEGAMAALLKEAIKPNLVQTLEGNPAFIHGGPFANIAHGCNSVLATDLAMKLGDFAITEAGFGADLGAEKFLDIKCREAGLEPDAAVIVATVRALKMHGGVDRKNLEEENLEALEKGLPNLMKHIENITEVFGLPAVVAINAFHTDTQAELDLVEEKCSELGINVVQTTHWANGGAGAEDLAKEVVRLTEEETPNFTFAYDKEAGLKEKIDTIVKKVYGGEGAEFSPRVSREIERLEELGYKEYPVCIAKTQYSFSDDPKLLGRPEGFTVNIRDVKVSAGAGFVVVLTGDIMTMPGLPKVPSAEKIDIDESGQISGLF